MIRYSTLKAAIIQSLSADLLTPQYRVLLTPDDPAVTGHCAVATEALYHLSGGRDAGYMPVVAGFDTPDGRQTHWWLRGPAKGTRGAGDIYDVTAEQFPDGFDYTLGHNTGFMQPQQKPSKRAQIVIDRVTALLGKKTLEIYKSESIKRFKQNPVSPSPRRKYPRL